MENNKKITPGSIYESPTGFEVLIGKEFYIVNPHFNPEGKKTIMGHFIDLIDKLEIDCREK